MPKLSGQPLGVLLLSSFSILVGFNTLAAKVVVGLPPQQMLFFRALIAVAALFGYAIFTRQLSNLKPTLPKLTLAVGVSQGLSMVTYFSSLSLISVAQAVLLAYTAPIFSILMARFFLKEKIENKTWWAIGLTVVGVVLTVNPTALSLEGSALWGSILALISGATYGMMAIFSKSLTAKTSPTYAVFWQYVVIVGMLTWFGLQAPWSAVLANWQPILYLGTLGGAVAFLLFMTGTKYVKGQSIQIITMLEIVVSIGVGLLFFRESLSLTTILGGAAIIGAVYMASRRN